MAYKTILPDSLKDLSETDVLNIIGAEYKEGYAVAKPKRIKLLEQGKLMNKAQDNGATNMNIDLKTLTKFIDTMMAVYYTDTLNVNFHPRIVGGKEIAKNLNRTARFDHKEMKKPILDYAAAMNRFLKGVGIQVMVGWNYKLQCPIFQTVDTMSWIPDPNVWFDGSEARYHGFDTSVNASSLSAMLGYDMERIKKLSSSESAEHQFARTSMALNQGLGTQVMSPNGVPYATSFGTGNGKLELYHHYTSINGKKYKFSVGDKLGSIVRAEEIKPIYEFEKEDPTLIEYPVALTYFFPQKDNPYGINVVDLVESQHRYENVLINLMFLKEKDAAVGADILFDPDKVKNKADLEEQSLARKYIPANDPTGAVAEIPKNGTATSTFDFLQLIKSTAEEAVAIDARQMGIQDNRDTTLGEAQQLQQNNNLRTIFKNRISNVGEVQFWKIWHRAYAEHFKESGEKLVRLDNAFGTQEFSFKKSDFICGEDPDIDIISMSELQGINDKKRAQAQPVMMMMLEDPTTKPYTKTQITRQLLVWNGLDEDEAIQFTGQSGTELDAISKRVLLDNNDPMGAVISDIHEEHETYIDIFNQGLRTKAQFNAIKARKEAIIERDKQVAQGIGPGGINTGVPAPE